MARRPPLTAAGVTRPSQALPTPAAAPEAAAQPPVSNRTPARAGKKAVAFWVDPEAATQLRVATATMGRTVQDAMEEALADWFQKHGLHRLGRQRAVNVGILRNVPQAG